MKTIELDNVQKTCLERAFFVITDRDGWQERFLHINEKTLQYARHMMSITPKCPEQEQFLLKLREAQHWLEAAIKKNDVGTM